MSTYQNNYYIAEDIINNKIVYGFFSKEGGLSKGKYFSLNCSTNSEDNKEIVEKNISIAKKQLGLKNHQLKFLKQTHSNRVEIIDNNNFNSLIKADGCITKNNNIALAILTADCAPIFIFDNNYSFICALHAGWKGCLNNIVKKAVDKINQISINTSKIIAVVGPCLSKENFEVDENFKDSFISQNFEYEDFFFQGLKKNKHHFDMRKLLNFQLLKSSVHKVCNVMIDTYLDENLFFSHRKSFQSNTLPTGRMINIIGFKNND